MTSPGPCCLLETPGVLDADHWHLEPRTPTSSSEGNPRGRGMETGVSIKDYLNSRLHTGHEEGIWVPAVPAC